MSKKPEKQEEEGNLVTRLETIIGGKGEDWLKDLAVGTIFLAKPILNNQNFGKSNFLLVHMEVTEQWPKATRVINIINGEAADLTYLDHENYCRHFELVHVLIDPNKKEE